MPGATVAVSLGSSRQALLERSDLHGDAFCHGTARRRPTSGSTGLLDQATGGRPRGPGPRGRGWLRPRRAVSLQRPRRGARPPRRGDGSTSWPTPCGTRCGTRGSASTTRCDARPRPSTWPGRTSAPSSGCSTAGWSPATRRWPSPCSPGPGQLWRDRAGHWLPCSPTRCTERHRSQRRRGFLLEPDLKEAHGGLRDIHAVAAAAAGRPRRRRHRSTWHRSTAPARHAHRRPGRAAPGHRPGHRPPARSRNRTRWPSALDYERRRRPDGGDRRGGAHRSPGWPTTPGGAARCGASRRPRAVGGGDVPRRAARRADAVGRRCPSSRASPWTAGSDGDRRGRARRRRADGAGDPALALRLAAVAAERDLPIGRRRARDPGRRRVPRPRIPGPTTCARRSCGSSPPAPPAIPALEALDQRGLLARLLPEWAGRAQPPAAQRLPPLHRRSPPPRGRRPGRPPRRAGAPPRPPAWSARCSTTSARASPATTPTSASAWSTTLARRMGFADRRRGRPHRPRPQPPAARRRGHATRPRRPGHRRRRGRRRRATGRSSSCWPR